MLTRTNVLRPLWGLARRGGRIPARWYSTEGIRTPYRKLKAVMVSRLPSSVLNPEQAVVQANGIFEALREIQALEHDAETLVVVLMPEFGLNRGSRQSVDPVGDDGEGSTWSAGYPLTRAIYEAFAKAVQDRMMSLPPGIVFASGGTAVDSGEELPGGKRAGWNAGFFMESGDDAQAIVYAKVNHERNDGWDHDVFEPGLPDPQAGALLRKIGGLTTLTVTCYDMTRLPQLPLAGLDVVLAGSKGTPDWQEPFKEKGIRQGSLVLVNELTEVPHYGGQGTGPQGYFKADEVPNHPNFKQFYELAGLAGLGDAAVRAYSWMFDVTREDLLGTHLGFVRQPLVSTSHPSSRYGITIRVSAPVEIGTVSGSWVEDVTDSPHE